MTSYPFYFISMALIVYLILVFKDWRNTIEQQKQNEQFTEKYEELLNQSIRSDFDPRSIHQLIKSN
jgi:hypothetical protein